MLPLQVSCLSSTRGNNLPSLESTRLSMRLSDPGGGAWQLRDFDLEVADGSSLAIVAPQRGLASCVLRALTVGQRSDTGGVLLDGRELCAADPRVAVIGRKPARPGFQTVAACLRRAVTRSNGRRLGRAETQAWVAHNLRLVGMEDIASRRLSTLSQHALARVELARALASDATVICLDHLFDGLDAVLERQCIDLMLELQARITRTMLFATDNVGQAVLMADRILCLDVDAGEVTASVLDVNLLRPRARLDLERNEEAGRLLEALGDHLGCRLQKAAPAEHQGEGEDAGDEDSVVFMADWVASQPERSVKAPEKREIALGFMPLIDSAPLVVALEQGFFDAAGLKVRLSRESSWSNIQDKVSLGLLDGAQMLAAMPLAAAVDPSATPLISAMALGRNGSAITVSTELWSRLELADEMPVDAFAAVRAVRREVERRRNARQRRLIFAMVAPHSSHNYLLRYWLACGDVDPDRDVQLMVVPPAQMVGYLSAGLLDGFCAGEPWNSVAVEDGLGRALISTWQVWNNHPEKVFGVTRSWADAHPNTHRALVRAMLDACWWLDKPDNRATTCEILSHGRYVNMSAEILMRSLGAATEPERLDARQCFHAGGANFPWHSHAAWLLAQMVRWGQARMPRDVSRLCADTYRTDIYRQAAAFGDALPLENWKREGEHHAEWQIQTDSAPLTLGSDRFMDDRVLDSADLRRHLAGYDIPASAGRTVSGTAA